jgi:putative selenium metabolism hydrolase
VQPSFQEAIRFAQDLIRIPSLPGQEGDLAACVLAEFKNLQFDDVWSDELGNCYARVRGRGQAAPVMLSCHLDAVDTGASESWEFNPFGGQIANGFLHGRGAMDIKGPLALQTHAAGLFLADRPPGDVLVAHTVQEERGGWGMEYLLQQGTVRPAAVIIGEATSGDLCIGHRGRAEILVELHGLAGHASAPERARNPIELLPHVLPVLQAFAAQLPRNDILGPSTLAATALETLPRSRNVIPDCVRIILDWRVLPGLTPDAAVSQVRNALRSVGPAADGLRIDVQLSSERQRSYTGRERDRPMFTPGFLLAPEHPVVQAASAAITRATGQTPTIRPWTFATDGGHACGVHGIPALGYAPGEERYAHTNRERLELESAAVVFRTYPSLVRAVQSAVSG